MADERATARPYTALMKFVQCLRNNGHTFVTAVVVDVAVEECSVCGAIKGDKNLLQLIAEAQNHTPGAADWRDALDSRKDSEWPWRCPCGYRMMGTVCSKCGSLRPLVGGAGCG